jgi:hypothetical protein
LTLEGRPHRHRATNVGGSGSALLKARAADDSVPRPADIVERPNELWVCDLSYLETREGFV